MRGPKEGDLRLVTHAWVQEMRHSPATSMVSDEVFFAWQRKLVLSLVRRSWTLCAVDPEDDEHLFGFIVFQLAPARLHWVYVKNAFQRYGLGTELLRAAFGGALGKERVLCSQASKFARIHPAYLARHQLVYDPFLLLKDTPHAESAPDDLERPETFDGPDSPGP